jgi:Uma2 family endonuclease
MAASEPGTLERRRFTVAEVERMVETGLLAEDEPVQLIDGELILMSPQGPEHSAIMEDLAERLRGAYRDIGHPRLQSPVRASDTSMPEPDIAVVRGARRDYLHAHPDGGDTLLVVEIAMTSQRVDRTKAAVYAAAGVPEYWIVDLAARCVEAHRNAHDGRYTSVTTLLESATLSPPGTALEWRVADLLP